jgi:DNA repair protein RecO (recombination protein O)
MTESTTGLILRVRPLTETSLIVQWLTRDCGRLATVAKAARRPKSPFRGKLDLFFLADFSFNRSRRSELHPLREVRVCATHPALRQDLALLRQASYCAALIEQVTETETPLPAIFTLMNDLLETLPRSPARPQTVFAFELRLLRELGLQPNPAVSPLTPGAREMMKALGEADWRMLPQLILSRSQAEELRRFLHSWLVHHFDRIPRTRDASL